MGRKKLIAIVTGGLLTIGGVAIAAGGGVSGDSDDLPAIEDVATTATDLSGDVVVADDQDENEDADVDSDDEGENEDGDDQGQNEDGDDQGQNEGGDANDDAQDANDDQGTTDDQAESDDTGSDDQGEQ